jgi:outer membrane protein OmpA-like peptidoglycan-associated protein
MWRILCGNVSLEVRDSPDGSESSGLSSIDRASARRKVHAPPIRLYFSDFSKFGSVPGCRSGECAGYRHGLCRTADRATAPKVPIPTPAQQDEVQQGVRDIHFDFGRSDLRMEERQTLASNAQWLQAHPDVYITIEGDADERGDIVYNVDLSDKRAIATRDALLQLGVPAQQIVFATGWGRLYPICNESDESCWSQNRRAHFVRWQHN